MNKAPVVRAGLLLGLGLGGFFDGIVLHQVLQWHHLVSEQYPPTSVANIQLNTLADGLFHVVTYIFTLAGLLLLWSAVRRAGSLPPTRVLIGAMLAGWGVFNLVEGLVNHHILNLHHVRHGPDELLWDLGFLAWGALMLVGGILLIRARQSSQTAAESETDRGTTRAR